MDQEPKSNLSTLHEQLVRDNYAVPQDYQTFEDTFRDPSNSKALYDQLVADKYAVPADYDSFVTTFDLKKKDLYETLGFGRDLVKEVFGENYSPEEEPEVSKKPPQAEIDAELTKEQKVDPKYSLKTPKSPMLSDHSVSDVMDKAMKSPVKAKPDLSTPDLTLGKAEIKFPDTTVDDVIREAFHAPLKMKEDSAPIDYITALPQGFNTRMGNAIRNMGAILNAPKEGIKSLVKKSGGKNADVNVQYLEQAFKDIPILGAFSQENMDQLAEVIEKAGNPGAIPNDLIGRTLASTGSILFDIMAVRSAPTSKLNALAKYGMERVPMFPTYLATMEGATAGREGKGIGETAMATLEGGMSGLTYEGMGITAGRIGQLVSELGAGQPLTTATRALANSVMFGADSKLKGGTWAEGMVMGSLFGGYDLGMEAINRSIAHRAYVSYLTTTDNAIRTISKMQIDPVQMRKNSDELWDAYEKETDPNVKKSLLEEKTAIDNILNVNAMTQEILKNPQAFIDNIQKDGRLSDKEKKIWTDKIKTTVNDNDPRLQEAKVIADDIKTKEGEKQYWQNDESTDPVIKNAKVEAINTQIEEQNKKLQDVLGKPLDDYAPEKEVKKEKKEKKSEVEPEAEKGDYEKVQSLAKKIASGKQVTDAESLQLQDNYPKLLEKYLKEKKSGEAKDKATEEKKTEETESKLELGEKKFADEKELGDYLESVAVNKETGEFDMAWFDREVDAWPSPETVKAVNKWTEAKKAEIKARKEKETVKEEPIETGTVRVEKTFDKNSLIDEIRSYNDMSASEKKKNASKANSIRVNAQKLGYELKEGNEWKIGIVKDGKFLAVRKDPAKVDKTKIANQKLLSEHDKEFQDYVNDVLDTNPDLFGVMIAGLSNEQRAQAFRDIKAGKKTLASSVALSELGRMHKEHGGIDVWNAEGQAKVHISKEDIRAEKEDMIRRKRQELDKYSYEDKDILLEKGLITKDEYDDITEFINKTELDSERAKEDFDADITGNDQGSKEKGTIPEGKITKDNAPENLKDRFGLSKTSDQKVIDAVPKTLIREENGKKIYSVDDDYVKRNIFSDFTEGGNGMAYPEFVPRDEIWVASDKTFENQEAIIRHELSEVADMENGKVYSNGKDGAHEIANEKEIKFRESQPKLKLGEKVAVEGKEYTLSGSLVSEKGNTPIVKDASGKLFTYKDGKVAEYVPEKEKPSTQSKEVNTVEDAIARYDNAEGYTRDDLINDVESITEDKGILNKIAEYREAQEADRTQYGKRSDLPEKVGDELEALIRSKSNEKTDQSDITSGKTEGDQLSGSTETVEKPVIAESKTEPSRSLGSATRFRPKERVDFQTPLTGPSGAKLVSYEWAWKPEEKFDKREGELKAGRVSDWDRALSSAETGRDVVHQFLVEMPDGSSKLMSAESALNVLGFTEKSQSKNMPSLVSASKTLAKNQMELSIKEAQQKAHDEAKEKILGGKLPEITFKYLDENDAPIALRKSVAKGELIVVQWKIGDATVWDDFRVGENRKLPESPVLSKERKDDLLVEYAKKRLNELNLKPQYGLSDLRNRVERQKKKIDEILSQAKSEEKPITESKIETPTAEGIKFKDKSYYSIEDVQDAFSEGKLTFDEQKVLMEDVRKFEDNLRVEAEKNASEAGKKLGISADKASDEFKKKNSDDQGKFMMRLLPPDVISKGNTVLWKELVKIRDAGANWIAERLQEGGTSKTDAIRWLSKSVTNWFGGLGRTQSDIMGKLKMTGTVKEFAPAEAKEMRERLLQIESDPESLRRVRDALDPEIAQEQLVYGDLTLSEKKLYDEIRQLNTWVHETNYAKGFIDTETYLKFKDVTGDSKYIARMYDQYETMPPEIQEFFKQGNNSTKTRIQEGMYEMRKEVDEWKKEHAIIDPTYLTAKRVMQTIQNVAIADYMAQVATEHPNLIRKVKAGEEVPAGFTKLSSSRKWGEFRNRAVANHIVEDFVGFFYANEVLNLGYDFLKGVDKLKLNQFYKKYRTVYNPFVQLGNFTGNMFFASIAGVNPATLTSTMPEAIRDMDARTPEFKRLLKSGILGSTGITADMKPIDLLTIPTPPSPADNILTKARGMFEKLDDKATKLYQGADNVAKFSAYKIFRQQGLSHDQAARRVYDAFQNYATVGKTWDVASKVPIFGNKFVKFQADLQRILLNSVTTSPLTTAGTLMMIGLAGKMVSALSGETDEERQIRESRKGVAKIPLPFGMSVPLSFKMGKSEVNMARYLAPLYIYKYEDSDADVAELSKFMPIQMQKVAKAVPDETMTIPAFSDPALGFVASLVYDRDFRGMSISNPEASMYHNPNTPTEIRMLNRLNYIGRSQVPFYRSAADLYNGITGNLDYYGRKRDWKQSILNNLVKVQQFDKPELKNYVERNIEYLTNRFSSLSQRMGDANGAFIRAINEAKEKGLPEKVINSIYKKEDWIRGKSIDRSLDEQVKVMKELERLTGVYKRWYPDDPFISENFSNIQSGKNQRFNVMDDIDLQKKYKEEYFLMRDNGLVKRPEVPSYINGVELTEEERKAYTSDYWSEYTRMLDMMVGLTPDEFSTDKSQIISEEPSETTPKPKKRTLLEEKASAAAEIARNTAKMNLMSKSR